MHYAAIWIIQELFVKHPYMQMISITKGAITCFFAVTKNEWNTNEETDESMKNALYVLWYAKWYLSSWSQGEMTSNSFEKMKSLLLAIFELATLVWMASGM